MSRSNGRMEVAVQAAGGYDIRLGPIYIYYCSVQVGIVMITDHLLSLAISTEAEQYVYRVRCSRVVVCLRNDQKGKRENPPDPTDSADGLETPAARAIADW